MYEINKTDCNFTKFIKLELNKLDDNDYSNNIKNIIYNFVVNVYNQPVREQKEIINIVNKLINNYSLTPIDLSLLDFSRYYSSLYNNTENLEKSNYYPYILYDGKYFYDRAYKITINKIYDIDTNEEEYTTPNVIDVNYPIHITKGGVITGEYIQKCYIKNIDKFYSREPINLECSRITNYDNINIYTIDARSTKLKALKEFYDTPINIDNRYKHIDIRKFKKL